MDYSPAELLAATRKAVAQVSNYLVGTDGGEAGREYKRDLHDIVTIHDQRAEQIASQVLAEAIPGCDILGEEGGHQAAVGAASDHTIADDDGHSQPAPVRFVIDPIDGTSNFAAGLPLYCISIAAQLHGETLAGVIGLPAMGLEFYAGRKGAYLQRSIPGQSGPELLGEPEPLGTRATRTDHESLVVTGYPSVVDLKNDRARSLENYAELNTLVGSVRSLGAGAIELAFVAAGWADATLGTRTNPWDVAAGAHLVSQSGGTCTHYPMDTGTTEPIFQPGYLAVAAGRELPGLAEWMGQIQRQRREALVAHDS